MNFKTNLTDVQLGDFVEVDGTRLVVNHMQELGDDFAALRGAEVTKTGRKVIASDGEGNCINVFYIPSTGELA